MRLYFSFFILLLLSSACSFRPNQKIRLESEQINLNLDNSFRGISMFEKDVWISGTQGTVVHYDAQTDKWIIHQIYEAVGADFRDIETLDENTSLAVSAGFPALIYKTIDAGDTWDLVYENKDSAVFLNAMEFWDKKNGLIFGDPMDGAIMILKTIDGGESWNRISPIIIPKANEMEGGFASSGSSLQVSGTKNAWVGVGGEQAKVYYSTNVGENWTFTVSPIFSGESMRGIYSLAFKDELHGIAVGGQWRHENPPSSRAYTTDGGKTWQLGQGVDQYRSGCCYLFDDVYLATGLTGTDVSYDGGRNWSAISDLKLHGLEFTSNGKIGYAMGAKGQIYRIRIVEE